MQWLRNNLFIVAALALPLAVIAFFFVATTVPRLLVADPQHDLVFALDDYDLHGDDIGMRYRVVDGQVMADARLIPQQAGFLQQRLYRFDSATGAVSEIKPEVPVAVRTALAQQAPHPANTETPRSGPDKRLVIPPPPAPSFALITYEVEQLRGVRLHDEDTAPDGYRFRTDRDGSPGLVGELFGMGRRGNRAAISRSGRVIALEIPDGLRNQYYRDIEMLGWIVNE